MRFVRISFDFFGIQRKSIGIPLVLIASHDFRSGGDDDDGDYDGDDDDDYYHCIKISNRITLF